MELDIPCKYQQVHALVFAIIFTSSENWPILCFDFELLLIFLKYGEYMDKSTFQAFFEILENLIIHDKNSLKMVSLFFNGGESIPLYFPPHTEVGDFGKRRHNMDDWRSF